MTKSTSWERIMNNGMCNSELLQTVNLIAGHKPVCTRCTVAPIIDDTDRMCRDEVLRMAQNQIAGGYSCCKTRFSVPPIGQFGTGCVTSGYFYDKDYAPMCSCTCIVNCEMCSVGFHLVKGLTTYAMLHSHYVMEGVA